MRIIKKAYIEITNCCNLSCPFCPGTTRQKSFMETDEFKAVLDKLSDNVQCLYFHVMGEPLLHPAVGDFLDIAHDAHLPVNLTTNGTMLDAMGELLLKKPALRQVNISLHSHADNPQCEDYLNGILSFAAKARAEGNVLISLRLWNQQGGEAPENEGMIRRLAAAYGCDYNSIASVGGGRGIALAEGVYLNRAELFQWPGSTAIEIGKKEFCMGLRDQIGILCDGTVVPCCLDGEGTMKLGNIFSQTLDEIINSPRAAAIYYGFSRRVAVEDLCRRCGYRQRFGN